MTNNNTAFFLKMYKRAKKVFDETEIFYKIKGNSLGGYLEEVCTVTDEADGQMYCLYADDLNCEIYALPAGKDPEWVRRQEEYRQMIEEELKASAEETALNIPDFDCEEPEYGTV